jgi:hypothetical protein
MLHIPNHFHEHAAIKRLKITIFRKMIFIVVLYLKVYNCTIRCQKHYGDSPRNSGKLPFELIVILFPDKAVWLLINVIYSISVTAGPTRSCYSALKRSRQVTVVS